MYVFIYLFIYLDIADSVVNGRTIRGSNSGRGRDFHFL